jgi:hypothetical protein
VTTGKRAPDGSLNAAELSVGSGTATKEIYRASRTFVVGDWVVGGVWIKSALTSVAPREASFAASNTNVLIDGLSNLVSLFSPVKGNGEWNWVAAGGKITAIHAGGVSDLVMEVRAEVGRSTWYYAPILLHIPAAELADNEGRELIQHLQSWADGTPVGHVSTLRGQKLITHGGLGVGNSAAATTLGSVTKKVEIFDAAGVSLGFVPVYGSIT